MLWLFALFLVTLPAVNVRLYASDEVQYFAFLRSLWFDRDLSFDNEYPGALRPRRGAVRRVS